MTGEPAQRPNGAALRMLGGAVCFAVMGALTHALGSRCDWLTVALARALFMFTTTAGLARSAGVRLVLFDPPTLWLRSIAGSFSLVCNFYALTVLPTADAITLSCAYPLWIVIATAWLHRRPPALAEVLCVLSGLAGVVLIQRPHPGGDSFAVFVALMSSVSTAVAMLGLHRLKTVDPRAVVAHFAGVASLVGFAWLPFRPAAGGLGSIDATTALLLAGVGITGTAGQYLLTTAYASGPPTQVAVVGLSQVAFAMSFDAVFWGRRVGPLTLLGFVLVLAPSAWVTARLARRRVRLKAPPAENGTIVAATSRPSPSGSHRSAS